MKNEFKILNIKCYIFFFSLVLSHSLNSYAKPENKQLDTENSYFLKAESILYDETKNIITANKKVSIFKSGNYIKTDKIIYDLNTKIIKTEGEVEIIDKNNNIYKGRNLIIDDKFHFANISDIIVKIKEAGTLVSSKIEKLNDDKIILHDSNYTSCKICTKRATTWEINAEKVELDPKNHEVKYRNAIFKIYKIPVIYTPYFSHSLPGNKGKSGILGPQIEKNSFSIPIYYRRSSNMDFTFTPKVYNKNILYQGEYRHLVNNGYYTISGSFTKENQKRFHIFSKGDFQQNNVLYGVDLKYASDKSFLKNYGFSSEPYLTSQIYFNHIENYDYKTLQFLNFQGLQSYDDYLRDPYIFPYIKYNKNYEISNVSKINIKARFIGYNSQNDEFLNDSLHINKLLIKTNLLTNINTDLGHVINSNYGIKTKITESNIEKTKLVIMPEFSQEWLYPLVKPLKNDMKYIIEPRIKIIKLYNSKLDNTDKYIEDPKIESSKESLFNHDYDFINKYDAKIILGLTNTIANDNSSLELFLGQENRIDKDHKNKVNWVAGINIKKFDHEIYYRCFSENRNFIINKSEIGYWYKNNNLAFHSYISTIKEDKKSNLINQIYSELEYKIYETWLIGGNIRTNLTDNNFEKGIISNNLYLTYFGDCVNMSFRVGYDLTSAEESSINKKYFITVGMKLKTLNW